MGIKRTEQVMTEMAKAVNDILNDGHRPGLNGFVILAVPFDEINGQANYVSNCRREDIISIMKTMIARWEGRVN